MKQLPILIVGRRDDPHVASVVRSLEDGGAQFALLDTFGSLSDGLRLDVATGVSLQVGDGKWNTREFGAVWWRQKPRFVVPTATADHLYDYFFVHREWNHVIDFLAEETAGAFAINLRDRANFANNKLTQLKVAVECGFKVPETIVSNDVSAVASFVSGGGSQRCVYKPLTPYMPPSGMITYTSEIDIKQITSSPDTLRVAPGIFQKFIEKNYELRVTVVGDKTFSARIDPHHSVDSAVDWRKTIFDDIYLEHDLEPELNERILAIHRRFGLFFCAYDLIVDRSGAAYLLDVNPAGQWMWLESRLNYPISKHIAAALIDPPPGSPRHTG
jgi:glutathione synthase/RimK-type ligase-like ATP-grasp enzyme